MTLTLPQQQPSATPLPWVLLQFNDRCLFLGMRGRIPTTIARVALESDALRIFRSVHAYDPMLTALRMVRAKLYADGGYTGVTGLTAQFNQREFLLLMRALAFAESEVGL